MSTRDLSLAFRLHELEDFAGAERLYRKILQAAPRNHRICYLLGVALAQQNQLSEALKFISLSLDFGPVMPEALLGRAQILGVIGKHRDALLDYDAALKMAPGNVTALQGRANSLHELRRFTEAIDSYNSVLALDPANPTVRNNRGNCFRELGQLDAALSDYARALEISPNYSDALYNRAIVKKSQKDFVGALNDFDRIIKHDPSFCLAWIGRGKTLRAAGDADEALISFERALSLAPENADAANGLAACLYEKGQIDQALRMFRKRAITLGRRPATELVRAPKSSHDSEQMSFLAQTIPGWSRESLFYLDSGRRAASGSVNHDGASAVMNSWKTAHPRIAVVDNVLTDEALDELRRFCMASTIWTRQYDAGYLGTTPEDGFACPLLAQIAEDFPKAFPEIFGENPLQYLWAFKYDSKHAGINIHADFAAVNLNFWITPDSANLDPDTGGLVIWDRKAPLDWDFEKYNTDETAIRAFLAGANSRPIKIPYRANRAVIFDSDLFHETDHLDFQDGYENRRINITLLYGTRETAERA